MQCNLLRFHALLVVLILYVSSVKAVEFGFRKKLKKDFLSRQKEDHNAKPNVYSLEPFSHNEGKTGSVCILKNLQDLGKKLKNVATRLNDIKENSKSDYKKKAYDHLCNLLVQITKEASNKERSLRPILTDEEKKEAKSASGKAWEDLWAEITIGVSSKNGTNAGKEWAKKVENSQQCGFTNDAEPSDIENYFTTLDTGHFMKEILMKLFPELKQSKNYWKDPFRIEFHKFREILLFSSYQKSHHRRIAKSKKLADEANKILEDGKKRVSPNPLEDQIKESGKEDLDDAVTDLQQTVTQNQRKWSEYYTKTAFDTIELQSRLLTLYRELFEPLDTFKMPDGKMKVWHTKYKWIREVQVFAEELAARALKKFEYEFKNPEKNIMTQDDQVYCIHVVQWDYYIEFSLLLREAMLKMTIEDKNPCKFDWGEPSNNGIGHTIATIQNYLEETCFASFRDWCPEKSIRNIRTSNCVSLNNKEAKAGLKLLKTQAGQTDQKFKETKAGMKLLKTRKGRSLDQKEEETYQEADGIPSLLSVEETVRRSDPIFRTLNSTRKGVFVIEQNLTGIAEDGNCSPIVITEEETPFEGEKTTSIKCFKSVSEDKTESNYYKFEFLLKKSFFEGAFFKTPTQQKLQYTVTVALDKKKFLLTIEKDTTTRLVSFNVKLLGKRRRLLGDLSGTGGGDS